MTTLAETLWTAINDNAMEPNISTIGARELATVVEGYFAPRLAEADALWAVIETWMDMNPDEDDQWYNEDGIDPEDRWRLYRDLLGLHRQYRGGER